MPAFFLIENPDISTFSLLVYSIHVISFKIIFILVYEKQLNGIVGYHEALGKNCSAGLNQLSNMSFKNLESRVSCYILVFVDLSSSSFWLEV